MKIVLFLISFNLVGIYSQAQQGEYTQVSTQESYNLACKQNSDGTMNCIKINKTQEEKVQAGTVVTQPVVKEKNGESPVLGFFLGGVVALIIVGGIYLFSSKSRDVIPVRIRC